MDQKELVEFLGKNLVIELAHELRGAPDDQAIYTIGRLKLAGTVISKAELRVIAVPISSPKKPQAAVVSSVPPQE